MPTHINRQREPRQEPIVLASADGAIVAYSGVVMITKGTAAALTLAAPLTAIHDGYRLTIVSTTAAAHTVTQTTPGFNNGSTASDVATYGAAIGNTLELVAYSGKWYVTNTIGVTLA